MVGNLCISSTTEVDMGMSEEARLKRNARMREWKRKNPEKVNALKRAYIRNNPHVKERNRMALQEWRYKAAEYILCQQARKNAKRKGIPFDLSPEDIIIPEFCPVLGMPLVRKTPGRTRPNDYPSLDRKDNSKGYIKGNVFVVSWRANRLKCDGSLEEFEAIIRYMKGEQCPSPIVPQP